MQLIRNDPTLIESAQHFLKHASETEEIRMAQAVILPSLFPCSLSDIGQIIGRSRASVSRLRKKFKAQVELGKKITTNWGGRRKSYLSSSEEKALLDDFHDIASKGSILEVSQIKSAYEKKIGRKVAKTTIYRMLARHGWRKIAPRKIHPKTSKEKQEAFKKNFRLWLPPK